MKMYIKYVIGALIIMAFSIQGYAQKRTTNQRKTTSVTKRTSIKKVPSSRVVYKKPQRKIVSVRTLNNKRVVKHKGQTYYYANNKFYTHSRGSFIVIHPKVGFRINMLPPNYRRVHFNQHLYFVFQGVFYVQVGNEYEVVDPEIGTVVYELPDDYEKVVIDGFTYYEYANILYEKIQVEGTRAYEVVGFIEMN